MPGPKPRRLVPAFVTACGAACLVALVASGATCAQGTQSIAAGGSSASSTSVASTGSAASSGSSSAGSTSSTSTASGGPGGSGVASSTASTGGTGGAASSSSASSSASSTSGVIAPSTIVWMQEQSSLIGADYDEATMMAGFEVPFADYTSDPLGLAFTGNGAGVLVARISSQPGLDAGPPGELRYSIFTGGGWSPGFGQSLLPVQTTTPLYINGGPSLAGSSIRAHSAYQGTDMKFYYAEYFGGTWSPTNEPISAGGSQSTGPVPPAIVTLNDTPIAAFVGADGNVYDQTRNSGTWGAANGHGVAGKAASITPSIVALTQGAELLLVYTNMADGMLHYALRTAGTWSAPTAIPGLTVGNKDIAGLAPIAAGGAVLAYEGTDSHLYTTVLSASAPFTWSAVARGGGTMMADGGTVTADPVLLGPPAVATGAQGADAELAYLDSQLFLLYTARLNGGAWGPRVNDGTGSFYTAIATGD